MNNGLVDTVKAWFTSSLVAELGTLVGEPEPSTLAALNKATPLLLKGLLTQLEYGLTPAALYNLVVQPADSAAQNPAAGSAEKAPDVEPGANPLVELLGPTYSSIVSQIAAQIGIQPSASRTFVHMAAKTILREMEKTAVENEFSPLELANWLRRQKDIIGSAVLKDAIQTALRPQPGPAPMPAAATQTNTAKPAPPPPTEAKPAPVAKPSPELAVPPKPTPAPSAPAAPLADARPQPAVAPTPAQPEARPPAPAAVPTPTAKPVAASQPEVTTEPLIVPAPVASPASLPDPTPPAKPIAVAKEETVPAPIVVAAPLPAPPAPVPAAVVPEPPASPPPAPPAPVVTAPPTVKPAQPAMPAPTSSANQFTRPAPVLLGDTYPATAEAKPEPAPMAKPVAAPLAQPDSPPKAPPVEAKEAVPLTPKPVAPVVAPASPAKAPAPPVAARPPEVPAPAAPTVTAAPTPPAKPMPAAQTPPPAKPALPPSPVSSAPVGAAPASSPRPARAAKLSSAPGWELLRQNWRWGLLLLLAMGAGYFLARSFIGQTQTADNPLAADQAPGPDNATGPNTPNKATAPAGKLTARGASRTSALASAAGSYDASRDVFIYNTGPETVITLPDGTRLLAGANSTERRLYRLLGSASLLDTIGPSRRWIVLDRIGFEPGTATLLPESAEQLGNLARLLKAFPRAQLLIGSYTDSTGRMVFNYQISAERARATMQALTRMGVPAARLQTRGYGPQSFLVPNTTPTNRALNRRTSIRVLNK